MRVAPPVDHPLARHGLWAGAAAALAALAVAAPILWAGDQLHAMRWGVDGSVWWGMTAAAILAAAAVAIVTWRRRSHVPERCLRWDGTGWQLREGAETIELDRLAVRIDLGHAALLSARTPKGGEIWLPVEQRHALASWHGLRVALNQPQRTGATAPLPTTPGEAAA